MFSKNYIVLFLAVVSSIIFNSCYDPTQKANPDTTSELTGVEYAPQMYHSEAYDPLTQVTDTSAGLNYWPYEAVGGDVSDYYNVSNGHGEFYNSNYYNQFGMNMRLPATGSIAKGEVIYSIHKDSIAFADNILPALNSNGNVYAANKNDMSAKFITYNDNMEECKELYVRFCSHCHGLEGNADGPVAAADKFSGVPKYNTGSRKDMTIGHVFHVITYGIRSMGSHASQLSQEERWKIATYVQELQKK